MKSPAELPGQEREETFTSKKLREPLKEKCHTLQLLELQQPTTTNTRTTHPKIVWEVWEKHLFVWECKSSFPLKDFIFFIWRCFIWGIMIFHVSCLKLLLPSNQPQVLPTFYAFVDFVNFGGMYPQSRRWANTSNEKRAPGCLGWYRGWKSYPVKRGLFHKPL